MLDLKALADHLRELGADSVWLYGSLAKGAGHRKSDIDLFVSAGKDAQRRIDRLYALHYPRIRHGAVVREAQIFTESVTGTNDPAFFCRMQPEARRVDAHE